MELVDTKKTRFGGWKLSEQWLFLLSMEFNNLSLPHLFVDEPKNNTSEFMYNF